MYDLYTEWNLGSATFPSPNPWSYSTPGGMVKVQVERLIAREGEIADDNRKKDLPMVNNRRKVNTES